MSRVMILCLLCVSVMIVFLSVHVRYLDESRLIFLQEPHLQRYFYVPKMLFAWVMLWNCLPGVLNKLKNLNKPLLILVSSLIVLWLAVLNFHNAFLYQSDASEGRRIRRFLAEAQENHEQARKGNFFQKSMILEREGDWDIVVKEH